MNLTLLGTKWKVDANLATYGTISIDYHWKRRDDAQTESALSTLLVSLATQPHAPSSLQAPTKTAPRGHPGGEMATQQQQQPNQSANCPKIGSNCHVLHSALLILEGRGGRFCPQKRSHHYHHRPSLWLNTRSSTKMPMAKVSNLRSVVCKIQTASTKILVRCVVR